MKTDRQSAKAWWFIKKNNSQTEALTKLHSHFPSHLSCHTVDDSQSNPEMYVKTRSHFHPAEIAFDLSNPSHHPVSSSQTQQCCSFPLSVWSLCSCNKSFSEKSAIGVKCKTQMNNNSGRKSQVASHNYPSNFFCSPRATVKLQGTKEQPRNKHKEQLPYKTHFENLTKTVWNFLFTIYYHVPSYPRVYIPCPGVWPIFESTSPIYRCQAILESTFPVLESGLSSSLHLQYTGAELSLSLHSLSWSLAYLRVYISNIQVAHLLSGTKPRRGRS